MLKVIYYNMTDFMGPVELLVFSILHRIPASFTLKILVGPVARNNKSEGVVAHFRWVSDLFGICGVCDLYEVVGLQG